MRTYIFVVLLCLLVCVNSQEKSEIIIGYSEKASIVLQRGMDIHQQVQESLNSLKKNGGGTLRFEEGLYVLSSNIEIGSNTAIIGAGINNTILKLKDKAKPWWIPERSLKKAGFINSKDTENLYFANFTIDGNKENQDKDKYSAYGRYGLYTETVDNVTVDGMGIINFQGYGFDPHGVKEPKQWSVGLQIINSYASNNDWDGFTIDQSTNVVLRNNVAYKNGRHGFNLVTGTYNVVMDNNIAYDNGFYYYLGDEGCGLAIQNNLDFGTRDISVTNNLFTNNLDAGICLRDVSNIKLIDNIIVNTKNTDLNPLQCIEMFNSVNIESKNNKCSDKMTVPFVNGLVPGNSSSVSSRLQHSAASRNVSALTIVILFAMIVSAMIV